MHWLLVGAASFTYVSFTGPCACMQHAASSGNATLPKWKPAAVFRPAGDTAALIIVPPAAAIS